MTNLPYKKKSTEQSNILQETYFAVCPYLIQFQNDIDYIFTINFQKDCQIIGQLSRLILPSAQKSKVQLEALKNVMLFRVAKDKKSHYKWTLYRRNQKGKQEIVQMIQVGLKDIIDNYLRYEIGQRQSIIKSKSKFQSVSQMTKSKKQSKFLKSGVLLHYLFYIASSEEQIIESVRQFQLKQKLTIVQKTFNAIIKQEKVQQESQANNQKKNLNVNVNVNANTNTNINANSNSKISQKKSSILLQSKIKHTQQDKGKNKKLIQFFDLMNGQNTTQNNQQKKKNIDQTKKSQSNTQRQNQESDNNKLTTNLQLQSLNCSDVTKKDKPSKTQPITSIAQFQNEEQYKIRVSTSQIGKHIHKKNQTQNKQKKLSQINIKSKNTQSNITKKDDQDQNDIRKSQAQNYGKIKNKLQTKDSFNNLKVQFEDIIKNEQSNQIQNNRKIQTNFLQNPDKKNAQTQNLALSCPSKLIKQPQLQVRNPDLAQTSYLRLDDIILNDKRISVSDKSSWMHTSKSKTDSKQNEQNKMRQTKSIKCLGKEDASCSDELMLNSKLPSELYEKTNTIDNQLLTHKNTLLKRGISIDDKKVFDQINMSHHKPKTLGQQQIRQTLNDTMYLKLNSRDDIQLSKGKSDIKIQQKYRINIPSMIEQDVELSRSFEPDNSRGNSLSQKKDSFQSEECWGGGISEINQDQIREMDRNWIDKRILDIQKFFVPKLKPVVRRIQKNQWTRKKYQNVKPFLSTKKIIVFILLAIIFLVFAFMWNIRASSKKSFKKKSKNTNKRQKKGKSIITRYLKG